jgi:hypothetical protein
MFRNSHNLRGSSTHAGNPAPRWRTVFIALTIALSIGSAGQTAPAQAAPDNKPTTVDFEVWAAPEHLPPLCINKEQKIYVRVQKVTHKTINDLDYEIQGGSVKGGATINSSMSNSDIGTLAPEFITLDGDSDGVSPGQVTFVFTAKKPGKTTLKFNSKVDPKWVRADSEDELAKLPHSVTAKEAKIDVIVGCNLKVKTLIKSSDEIYDITGISDEALMKPDDNGNYTGSASMYWVYSYVGGVCDLSASATDSQIDLTGKLDDDGGQFLATETFHPYTISTTITCPYAGTSSGESTGTVPPLTFKVASSGGSSTQTLGKGSATIFVIPQEDKAVSFFPGNPEASWDDFSSLFGVLLALR